MSCSTCPPPSLRAAIAHKLRFLPARLQNLRLRSPVYEVIPVAAIPEDPATHFLNAYLLAAAALLLIVLRRLAGARRRATAPKGNSTLATAATRRNAARPGRSAAASRAPIASLTAAVEQIQAYADEFKYFDAGALLDELRAALDSRRDSVFEGGEVKAAEARLDELLADGLLEKRVATVRRASGELNSDDGFEFVKEDEDMRMFTRVTSDRVLTVKIEAILEGVRPADTLFLWREAHLYPNWFPLITKGAHIEPRHPFEALLHLGIETPFTTADLVLNGFGCDAFERDGGILMCVRSVRQSDLPGVALPLHPSEVYRSAIFKPTRIKADIDVLFEPLTPTSVRFVFAASHSLEITKMPDWMSNFFVQQVHMHALAPPGTAWHRLALPCPDRPCPASHVPHLPPPSHRPPGHG